MLEKFAGSLQEARVGFFISSQADDRELLHGGGMARRDFSLSLVLSFFIPPSLPRLLKFDNNQLSLVSYDSGKPRPDCPNRQLKLCDWLSEPSY
ncbi:hypothetical protein MHYP_G00045780 [Metynnis hypsauchen]